MIEVKSQSHYSIHDQARTPRADIINESRIRRIAKGCGRSEKDVNDLYDRFLQTRRWAKLTECLQ